MLVQTIIQKNIEQRATLAAGYDTNRLLIVDDLVADEDVFLAATSVTDGALLRGVRFEPHRIATHSPCMRSRPRTAGLIKGHYDRDWSLSFNFTGKGNLCGRSSNDRGDITF